MRSSPVPNSASFTAPDTEEEDLSDLLMKDLPSNGSTIGNLSAREASSGLQSE